MAGRPVATPARTEPVMPLPAVTPVRGETEEVTRKRQELADAQEKQKAEERLARKAKEVEDFEVALERARTGLLQVSREKPIALKRVTFLNAIIFEVHKPHTNMIDLDNAVYAGTVLLFDGALVHVVRPEPGRTFLVPVGAVLSMTPREDARP